MSTKIKSKFLYKNVIDLDLTAEYPNIIISGNINNDSQFGKIMFKKPHPQAKDILVDYPAEEFVNSLITTNYIHTCSEFFNLPNIDYYINKINKNKNKYLK